MSTITISTNFTEEETVTGVATVGVQMYIDSTSGFTTDPGNKLFLGSSEDGVFYYESVCGVSDMRNYPEDAAEADTPYYRQGHLYRMFPTKEAAVSFCLEVENHLQMFADDWEAYSIATPSNESYPLTDVVGSIEASVVQVPSSHAYLPDGQLEVYHDATLTVTFNSTPNQPVFVVGEGGSLDHVATYDDMTNLSIGTTVNTRTDEITIFLNSVDRYEDIIENMVADVSELVVTMGYLDS